MSNKSIERHFEEYKSLIKQNIKTIQELLEHSEQLEKFIDNDGNDDSKNIKKIRDDINLSIKELLKNTENLFAEYKKLITDYAEVA
ncbi:MAG: hypothetical protein K0U39_07620 [Alphaproteobacteria bacterium]|nr:hypothetical protein [Alphaproteobacteria bacterium]